MARGGGSIALTVSPYEDICSGAEEEVRSSVAVVIIGRNEGQRLVGCLDSLKSTPYRRVYVDSMSTDKSVSEAKDAGADVVVLGDEEPLTAARGRNVGVQHLLSLNEDPQFIQFVDGDTELAEGWLSAASDHLRNSSETAIVCGHLHEKDATRSIFHRLCDMEWEGAVGKIEACGGIFMIRTDAFSDVDGFIPGLI